MHSDQVQSDQVQSDQVLPDQVLPDQRGDWWPELGPSGRVWVFAGDSITHGVVHTGTSRDYVELFAEQVRWARFGEVMVTTGYSGWRITDLAAHLDYAVLRHRPEVVSLMFGTNDCAEDSGSSPEQFAADYRRQLDQITAAGAPRLILQTPPGVTPAASGGRAAALPAFVDQVRRIADERGLLLVDHFAHWQAAGDDAEPWYADPFHPNAAGHAEMARLLCETLHAPGRG